MRGARVYSARTVDSPTPRAAIGLTVGLLSACVMVLEVVQHQLLAFFSEYLSASLAINSAILGLGLGGVLAFGIPAARHGAALVVAPFATLAGVWLGPYLLATRPFDLWITGLALALPFAGLSVGMSLAYVRAAAARVYAASLVGGAAGAVFVGLAYQPLGAETLLLVVSLVLITIALMEERNLPERTPRAGLWIGVLWAVMAALVAVSPRLAPVDLVRWAALFGEPRANRIQSAYAEDWKNLDFTRWDLEGRIDLIRSPEPGTWVTCINGFRQDTVVNAQPYLPVDPRFPPPLPDRSSNALIFGLSAEGVAKQVRQMVAGRVVGVELNPSVVEAMTGPFWELSGRAYRGIDVYVLDGRSYVESTRETFGLITLMSVHPPMLPVGIPEYLYTRECVDRYMELLIPSGLVNIEESLVTGGGNQALGHLRVLSSFLDGLKRAGVAEPDRCVMIFGWEIFPGHRYIHFLIRRTPFTKEHLAGFPAWAATAEKLQPRNRRLIYDPTGPVADVRAAYEKDAAAYLGEPLPADRLTAPLTDDHPFIHPTRAAMPDEWRVVSHCFVLALVGLLPCLGMLARVTGDRARAAATLAGLAILGTGYLLVELHLIHRLHLFLGSHSRAFVVVLTGLFLSGGLAGPAAASLSSRSVGLVSTVLVGIVIATDVLLAQALPRLLHLSPAAKLAGALLAIAPVGLAMGIPYPLALGAAKARHSDRFAALAFAANSALCVAGSGLHLILAVGGGMSTIVAAASVAYLLAGALLRWGAGEP